jgi:flavin reductase (DIM6/NTAB) family NADH-FMN oxidoreductase RutF
MAVTPSAFTAAMGQHASSVCIITTTHEDQRYGLTATAMCSVSAEPPRLLVCVNKSGSTHDRIIQSGIFCVNILSEFQEEVAKSFAGMMGKNVERFSTGIWVQNSTGAPVLADAVASFDCSLAQTIDQSSHTIFIGDVLAVAVGEGIDPLLYGARKFRTLFQTGKTKFARNSTALDMDEL